MAGSLAGRAISRGPALSAFRINKPARVARNEQLVWLSLKLIEFACSGRYASASGIYASIFSGYRFNSRRELCSTSVPSNFHAREKSLLCPDRDRVVEMVGRMVHEVFPVLFPLFSLCISTRWSYFIDGNGDLHATGCLRCPEMHPCPVHKGYNIGSPTKWSIKYETDAREAPCAACCKRPIAKTLSLASFFTTSRYIAARNSLDSSAVLYSPYPN